MSRPDAAFSGAGPTARLALLLLPRLNLFALLARSRGLFWPFLTYSSALQRRTGLDPVLRELVILRVAHNEDCPYERQHHLGLARGAGASGKELDAVSRSPLPASEFDPRTRAALALADHLALGPACPGDVVGEARRQLGETTVAELVLLTGHYAAIARLIRCLDVPLDSPDDVEAALRVHRRIANAPHGTWREQARSEVTAPGSPGCR